MSSAAAQQLVDPAALTTAADLLDGTIDLTRTVCLSAADASAIGRAIVAMANSRGGDILAGIEVDGGGRVLRVPGVDADAFERTVTTAAEKVDPPVTHLLSQRLLTDEEGSVGLIHVRLSPSAPHLLTTDGGIYWIGAGGIQPIRSRRALDDLYARGRGERERADRLVEAMIEKLVLAHYAFYTLAVIACTHQPSGEPYRKAQAEPSWLAPAEDPFVAAFALHQHEARVSPGEIELRTPGDVNAYIRITRTGCVAVGEVQRRPYHDELDTAAQLEARLERLVMTAARLLAAAQDTLMLPHVFVEGVRGLRLVRDPEKRTVSNSAPQDTARHPLTVGDARDAAYLATLPREAMSRLETLFP